MCAFVRGGLDLRKQLPGWQLHHELRRPRTLRNELQRWQLRRHVRRRVHLQRDLSGWGLRPGVHRERALLLQLPERRLHVSLPWEQRLRYRLRRSRRLPTCRLSSQGRHVVDRRMAGRQRVAVGVRVGLR